MSKSLARVEAAQMSHGLAVTILACGADTRTAAQAAGVAGVEIDQIVKSIIFRGETSGRIALFLTAGGNRVDADLASALAREPLGRADADQVRAETGFAIGGAAPVGHLSPVPTWADPRLLDFGVVWAAAGTPQHIFAVAPETLVRITGATVAPFAV